MIDCAALLFNLDGTLIDATAVLERTWKAWAEMHNLDPQTVVSKFRGMRARDGRAFDKASAHAVEEGIAGIEALSQCTIANDSDIPAFESQLQLTILTAEKAPNAN